MAPEPARWLFSCGGRLSSRMVPEPKTPRSADRRGASLAEPLPESWASTSWTVRAPRSPTPDPEIPRCRVVAAPAPLIRPEPERSADRSPTLTWPRRAAPEPDTDTRSVLNWPEASTAPEPETSRSMRSWESRPRSRWPEPLTPALSMCGAVTTTWTSRSVCQPFQSHPIHHAQPQLRRSRRITPWSTTTSRIACAGPVTTTLPTGPWT